MSIVKLVGITNPQIRIPVEDAEPGTFMLLSPESFIAYCARVSNPSNQNNTETAEKLLKYLVKNKHWSPFEMVHIVMEINTTRDIARQILRHRSFSFQEFSQRYAEIQQFSEQREARLQDTKNRQNSIETNDPELQDKWNFKQEHVALLAYDSYRWAIENGIAKEVARSVLPEGLTMSRMYMSGSLRSWIHYCELRMGNGTQKEHREIATQCWNIITEQFPSLKNVLDNQ
jgi:thymidylate synthase (FAD)